MIIYLKKKTFKKYILFSNKNLTILVFYIFFFLIDIVIMFFCLAYLLKESIIIL